MGAPANLIERINKQRNHWQEKGRQQLEEVYMASLERSPELSTLLQDLGTTLIILDRFNERLDNARKDGHA